MTDRRFALAEHLLDTQPWQLFAMVEMGTDRIHHGFWKAMDAGASQARCPAGLTRHAIRDYYGPGRRSDRKAAQLADDDTAVLVVSDHGAKRLDGGIRINEWLRREGLLAPHARAGRRLRSDEVGSRLAERTVAWGDGGYYARVFLNVKGREPEGIVPPEDYEAVRDDLIQAPRGDPRRPGTAAGDARLQARGAVPEVNGVAPDLIVDLRRSALALGRDDRRRRRRATRSRTTPVRTMRTTRRTAIFIAAGAGDRGPRRD